MPMQSREALIRLVAVLLLAYMLTAIVGAQGRLQEARSREQALRESCALLRKENEQLQAELSAAPEDAALEALARERLGMVLPGERIYYFIETERVNYGAEAGGDR